MGVNSLPMAVTRQHRGCDLNPGPSAPESSTLTTRLPLLLLSIFCNTTLSSVQFFFAHSVYVQLRTLRILTDLIVLLRVHDE